MVDGEALREKKGEAKNPGAHQQARRTWIVAGAPEGGERQGERRCRG